ncbi:MAG: type II toxin-antitoxin system VapC family toxin [Proteobacteria bacterium]|nr:type II toxin-antitoxin system VapC family toxin [Pseudomonadota bacterium]
MTLIDTNILLDVFGRDPNWWRWSVARLDDAAQHGPLLINDIIYTETSIRFPDIAEFDGVLADMSITVAPFSRQVAFVAGKAFAAYRGVGGRKDRVLPDFFIGAHAEVERLPLLTRDARRYRTYFPAIELIAPDQREN